VVSEVQFKKIQDLIESGIKEGATLVTGGPGRPADLNRGYYVRPTVFANVTPDMRIAKEEIFGPVLSIMPYDTVEQVIDEANNTVYGLASYIQAKDMQKARDVAARMRTGNVYINYPSLGRRPAVRRLQAVGQRPRICRIRAGGFPRDQGHRRIRGRIAAGPARDA
jgi:aldehyde dehydrogenase (NAD+)